jgi:hypothetical protein
MLTRRSYSPASLEPVLEWFEAEYGTTSAEFYDAHVHDRPLPEGITGLHRHVWASFYREVLAARSFADHAGRVLAGSR